MSGWPVSRTIRKNKQSRHLPQPRRRERGRASVPASSRNIVCHFLHEIHCEYCLKQLGSSDPYRLPHNSVYMMWRKCGHGAHFRECVCVFLYVCMSSQHVDLILKTLNSQFSVNNVCIIKGAEMQVYLERSRIMLNLQTQTCSTSFKILQPYLVNFHWTVCKWPMLGHLRQWCFQMGTYLLSLRRRSNAVLITLTFIEITVGMFVFSEIVEANVDIPSSLILSLFLCISYISLLN